jgi:hypothetical protein
LKGGENMKNNTVTLIIVAVVVLAAGFFAGMKYQETKQPSFNGQRGMMQGQRLENGNTGANRRGFRPANGEVVSVDDKSVTVKLQDGSSKIVLLSDKTTVNKQATGSISDLKVGEKIVAFGTENSDGSITAQSIQLNPTIGINAPNQQAK